MAIQCLAQSKQTLSLGLWSLSLLLTKGNDRCELWSTYPKQAHPEQARSIKNRRVKIYMNYWVFSVFLMLSNCLMLRKNSQPKQKLETWVLP